MQRCIIMSAAAAPAAATAPWDREETAGDPTVSQQIILASARKTAAEADLTERGGSEKESSDSDSKEVTPQ